MAMDHLSDFTSNLLTLNYLPLITYNIFQAKDPIVPGLNHIKIKYNHLRFIVLFIFFMILKNNS
jgi:hypothetical protein